MPVAAAAVACVWAFLYSKQGCITQLLECPEGGSVVHHSGLRGCLMTGEFGSGCL